MKRMSGLKKRPSAILVGCGMLFFGSGCTVDNFWVIQLNNTLTTIVDSIVNNTIISAINTAFGT